MEWTITIHKEEHFTEVLTSGLADDAESLKMARDIAPQMLLNRINKVLIDHRQLDEVSGRTADIVSRQKDFVKIGVIRPIRIALVIRPEHEKFFKFFELVMHNRGYRVSIFMEKEPAIEWLQKS